MMRKNIQSVLVGAFLITLISSTAANKTNVVINDNTQDAINTQLDIQTPQSNFNKPNSFDTENAADICSTEASQPVKNEETVNKNKQTIYKAPWDSSFETLGMLDWQIEAYIGIEQTGYSKNHNACFARDDIGNLSSRTTYVSTASEVGDFLDNLFTYDFIRTEF